LDNLPSDLEKAPNQSEQANPFTKPNSAKQKTASAPRSKLTGEYELIKKGLRADANDPKWEIWTHIYECHTFEDVFAKSPAKVFKTGGKTIASPSTELAWALKQGWIKPVAQV
jgi:hypothetical protein